MAVSASIEQILRSQRLIAGRDHWEERLAEVEPADVEAALAWRPGSYSLTKLLALISPAAENYLEPMAQASRQLTLQRFGRHPQQALLRLQ